MNFTAIYDKIISNSWNRERFSEIYYERHHIIPRCMEGSDDKTNIALLTAREHYVCHHLLCLIHKNDKYGPKLMHAFIGFCRDWQSVCHKQRRYKGVNSRIYQRYKEILYGENGTLRGKNHYAYGVKRSLESCQLISERRRQYWKEVKEGLRPPHTLKTGCTYTDESKKKMSETRKQNLASGKTKNHMSKSLKIDGVIYRSCGDVIRTLGVSQFLINKRCNSADFPNYEFID